jgi:predicted ATPase/DNA-binding SARP family transcriptional activator
VEVRVLGEPHLRVDGKDTDFPRGRPGRLLAALLLARGRVVGTERLVDAVWGDEPPAAARAALHTTVARVRRALGPHAGLLERAASGYRLDQTGLVVDADRFLGLLTPTPGERPDDKVARLDAALALWGGSAWSGLADDLAVGEARRLEEGRLVAFEQRAAALLEAGRTAEAVGELRLLVAEEPLREPGVALLMTALHRSGDIAESLTAYAAHRDLLAEELGLDPSAELAALHREVLLRAPTEPASVATAPVEAAPAPVGVVPVLHGRAAQLETLRQMLGLHRCVCVVGPGGVGKTSLAAHAVRDSPHWWVDLASVTAREQVHPAVAEAVGAEVFPGVSVASAIHHRLAAAEGTIVLDNCEHLLVASGDLVEELLRTAGPGVRVLATSRERLGTGGERVFPLPPLQLPSPDDRVESPAVALFLERARAVEPDLEADPATLVIVGDLVRRLDGLPLAIELAAGRVGGITLDDLLDRLGDRLDLLRSTSPRGHSRQRTVVSTIEWSYELLSDAERSAFLRLSVFAGRFDLAAAEAVLGGDGAELVSSLAERSLLVRPGPHGHGEYRMLETLRAFAVARLDEEERASVRRAHARWVDALVTEASVGLCGPDELRWGRRLDDAMPDAAAAVRWAVGAGEAALAARIVGGLHRWAYFRLRPDVLAWALDVLRLGKDGETPLVHVCAAAHFWATGEHDSCRAHAERALELSVPGTVEEARALDALSDLALAVGEFGEAATCCSEAYDQSVRAGRWADATMGAVGMTLAATYAGEPALPLLAIAHRAAALARNPSWTAFVHYCEGEVLAGTDPERALAALDEAVRVATPVENRLILGVSLTVEIAVRGRSGPLDRLTVERSCHAVEHWMASGNDSLFLTCLRNLVPLLERFGADRELVELVSATSGTDAAYGAEAVRIESGLRQAQARLGEDAYARAWAGGAARSPIEAGRQLLRVLPTLL